MVEAVKGKPRRVQAGRRRQVMGAKGGAKKQKQPSIASNGVPSIATARMVYLWSWGPIVGPVDGLRSVKLDGTPLVAEDGTVNFPGVKWQFRSGELHQARLDGVTESSNEIQVDHELRSSTPWVHTITNPVIDAVRVRLAWPQLQKQDSSGNVDGVRIEYAIDVATDGGPYQQVLASEVNRKNVTKYERSHRIELPQGSRWTLRVRRLTPEANSSMVADGMLVDALAEVVDSDQEYPLTAVSCIEYDAQQFDGDIAKIAVLMRGRIVSVPANYDPETRTYATAGAGTTNGIWDGTFKEAYTNNPAWIFYDLALHPYYGLGDRIDASMINRWSLYRIAQYCDQLVPDGNGGQEPRFTCNLYLQKQAEAWAVLQDLAAIFHGLAYWDGSQIVVNADMPQDSAYTYTLSQILGDGAIEYSGSKWRDRHSLAMVSFDDPDQSYETDKEPVFDEDAIAEYGVRETSVEAVGCTSRGQAQRAGQWALQTEQLQLRGATVRVGLDGYIPKPGKVISLADPMLAGRANGGRIAAVAGRVVTVDRDIEVPTGARLLVNLPSGKTEARQVRSVSGRLITLMADYSEAPQAECGWALDYDDLKLMQFYVRNVTRPEWHQFQLELIQHEPSKFDAVDYGTVIDDRPISVLPPGVQEAPARVLISSHASVDQGIAVTTMTIAWDAAPGAVAYDVEWRWGSRDWVKMPRTGELSADVRGVYAGQYLARVRAVSAMGVSSIPASSVMTNVQGKTTPPPAVTHLTTESLIFGIGLKWGFPAGAEDTQRTELWYSEGTDLAAATKLADLAYPQSEHTLQGLRGGQRFFFWARLVDRSGNIGPWFPADGTLVSGMASMDAGPILEQIKDQITESELGKELTSKIDLVDGNGPGSVNERVGTAKTELAKQISEVNNALASTKSNLQQQITSVGQSVTDAKAELQQQITAVSTLAGSLPYRKDKTYSINQSALGSDGKLYQAIKAVPLNTPPPNATYWTDVGQAVVTANGIAARVSKVETDVSTLDDKTTAQASQIQSLQTSLTATDKNVAKKADATVVDSLTLRVSDAEGKLTSEGKRIDGLQTSLDGKASSTALQQVTARVTATEQKDAAQDQQLTSQSQALTSLTDTVSKKAEAATVQALSNDVKQQGQTLEAQGQSLTRIDTALPNVGGENLLYNPSLDRADPTKAWLPDGWELGNSGAQELTSNLVASTLDPSGKALRLAMTLPNAGSYVDLLAAVVRRAAVSTGQILTLSAYFRSTPGLQARLYFQWVDGSNSIIGTGTPATMTGGDAWQRIVLTSSAVPAGAVSARIIYRVLGPSSGTSSPGFFEWDRLQLEVGSIATGWRDNGQVNAAEAQANASATTALTGRVEKAEQGLSSTSSQVSRLENSLTTTNGNVTKAQQAAQQALTEVAKKADASTVQSLSNDVRQQGQQITADGQAITRIDTAIASSGSENLLFNPSFDTPSTGNPNIAEGWTWRNTSGTSVTPTLRSSDLGAEGKCQRLDVAGLSADSSAQYVDFVPESGRRPPIYPGVAVTASIYIRGNSGLMVQIYLQFKDAAGNTLLTNGPTNSNLDPTYRRPFLISAVAPEGSVRVDVLYRIRSGPGSSVVSGFVDFDMAQLEQGTTLTGWRDNGKANAYGIAVNAAATSALTGRVEDNERGLTSTSGQLTQLENSIGDVGGENLFYNPAFTQYASANGSPEGWATEGPVTSTDTIVPSWLNSGEKAQRIVAPGLTSSNQYKSLRPVGSRRIKVSEGQAVTASVYARKSEGNIGMRIFIQWISSSDAVLGAPASNLTSLTTAGARLSFSAVAPAGAVEAYVYFRTYAMTATATNGTVEYARPQAEYGTRATGWRDNSQVVAAQQAVTSAAVESLNSTVSQQGNTLSSVSGRTTSLENAINSTSSGLATKASAEAVNSLGNRVKQTEDGLSSASSSVVDLRNSIAAVEKAVGSATGLDPAPGANWQFENGIEGWAVTNATATVSNGVVRLTPTTSDPQFLSSNGPLSLSIPGAQYTKVRVGLTRRGGGASAWTGTLYYSTAAHGITSSYRASAPNPNLAVGQSGVVEWDMATLAVGGTDWVDSTIGRLRFNFANDISSVWDIDWIAVGRVAPGASSRALSSLESTVDQQGSKLTAETKRIDGLYASVDSANAAVQSEAKARADADSAIGKRVDTVQSNLGSTNASVQQISAAQANLNGKVNATWSVKLGLTSGGNYYAAGFGLGLENQGGTFQSSFVVLANQFAVMNPVGEGLVSVFAAENGQVVIADALISKLSVQKAMVGSTIASAALTNWGPPVLAIDFQSGLFRVHHPTKSGHYVSIDRNGVTLTAGGVNLVEMSFD